MHYKVVSNQTLRSILVNEFYDAPIAAWFGQETVAALRGCSEATIERDRWAGTGVPFIKCGRSVRYKKTDILKWLEMHQSVQSTTQAEMAGVA